MLLHDVGLTPKAVIVTRPEVTILWETLRREADAVGASEDALSAAMRASVLDHRSFGTAMSARLAEKLGSADLAPDELLPIFRSAYADQPQMLRSAAADLVGVRDRDPSNDEVLTPFLYFKGFLALQSHRVAHWLWQGGRRHLARHIQSRCSEVLSIDIHPAAVMGCGIMLDHGNGLVIGETAVVEDDVSILQNVTLGGTGKESGDRHPKIRRGVLIGAGAKILGNIEIGEGAKIGAGSVVLAPVDPYTSVVGIPARRVGRKHTALPGVTMDQSVPEPEYMI
ncbi:serine O-acetyltransferase [Rhizobium sp.]